MAIPREPRQKMINMMYLVLTALLALNVSAEILNAFKTVNKSLESSTATVNSSTDVIMTSLKEKLAKPESQDRAKVWYPKAEQVAKLTKDVDAYIQGLKNEILKAADFDPATGHFKDDDLDIPTRIMIDKGNGMKLKKMIEEYKTAVLALDPKIKTEFENALPIDLSMPKTQNKSNNTWDKAYFHMVPTVASLTILSKFQNDVKTSENKIINFCHEQVGKVEQIFDAYEPILGQNSNYLLPGQELQIKAGIGAFNSQAQPEIYIGGTKVNVTNGVGLYSTKVGNTGGSIPVRIKFFNQKTGQEETKELKVDYAVGQTSTAVALDKLNVLFIGVDNEVTISASGGAEKINATLTGANGTITRSGNAGHFIARVNPPDGECNINVTVDGKTVSQHFRVRSIPDPTPMIGAKVSGEPITASEFKAQPGVRAILANFFYEAQFTVTNFRIIAEGEGFDDLAESVNEGPAWSPKTQQNIINRIKKGSIITIDNIRCVGPDKRTRRLPSINYVLR